VTTLVWRHLQALGLTEICKVAEKMEPYRELISPSLQTYFPHKLLNICVLCYPMARPGRPRQLD
jgi:hypothetical protein